MPRVRYACAALAVLRRCGAAVRGAELRGVGGTKHAVVRGWRALHAAAVGGVGELPAGPAAIRTTVHRS
jgi:hypothetical protein